VAPSGELRGKGRCGVLAGKTVWSTSERLRCEVLTTRRYRNLRLPLPLPSKVAGSGSRDLFKILGPLPVFGVKLGISNSGLGTHNDHGKCRLSANDRSPIFVGFLFDVCSFFLQFVLDPFIFTGDMVYKPFRSIPKLINVAKITGLLGTNNATSTTGRKRTVVAWPSSSGKIWSSNPTKCPLNWKTSEWINATNANLLNSSDQDNYLYCIDQTTPTCRVA